jgi:hypothetical protein
MHVQAIIITRDYEEITVFGEFEEGERGRREAGVPIEPDYPDAMAVLGAEDADGNKVELTDDQEREAEAALWEELKSY